MDVKGMQEIVMRKYSNHTPKHTCWRARRMLKDAVDIQVICTLYRGVQRQKFRSSYLHNLD